MSVNNLIYPHVYSRVTEIQDKGRT